jgi:hypothetical protein
MTQPPLDAVVTTNSRHTPEGKLMRYPGLAALGAVAVIGAGAVVLPAVGSTARADHTLKLTSVELKSTEFGKTKFGQSDVDRNNAGKKIGFDTLNGMFNPKTGAVKIDVAFDTKDGFMYFHLHSTSESTFEGAMTGGTGKFKHAQGTLEATNLNKSGTRTAVTIKYH